MISVAVKLKSKVSFKGITSDYHCCFDNTIEAVNFIENFKYIVEYVSKLRTGEDECPKAEQNMIIYRFRDLDGLRKIQALIEVKR